MSEATEGSLPWKCLFCRMATGRRCKPSAEFEPIGPTIYEGVTGSVSPPDPVL